MEKNKLIAVYGRVSTSNQEDQKTIEAQLSEVREFAQKNGYKIIKEYIDEGWSGDILARPSLDELRHDARERVWDAVLIYDPDRLGRRLFYQQIVIDELNQLGIETLFVTMPPIQNAGDELMFGVKGLFAQYEKTKITERFRIGKMNRVKNNQILITEAPYGYIYIPNRGKRGSPDYISGHCVIDEREAQIVRNIFSWVADDGLTLRAIVKKLKDLDIKPRKSKRGVWNTSTLSSLLRNKTYIGQAHYGASYAVVPTNPIKKVGYKKIKKTSRRMKPENEWISITTPKIIEEDLFIRAGQRLKSNFLMSSRNTKNEYLIAGKIWCDCGKRRAGEGPQKGKHLYYRCTDRVKSFPLPSTCKEKGLNARIVDEMVWERIVKMMSSPKLLRKHAERWLNNKSNGMSISTINVIENKKEIKKLETQIDRYAKAYGIGTISLEQFKDYTSSLKEQVISLNDQITKVELEKSSNQEILPKLEEIDVFTKKAIEMLGDLKFEAKKAIVRSIITKVVGTRERLQVNGFIPVTSNINVFTEYRNRRSAKRR